MLDAVAYIYLAGQRHDMLEPILATPEGKAAYAVAQRRIVSGLALLDVPLLVVAGGAAYALAVVSVRPLVAAREREARFAAEAAHELRTPLARIASLTDVARSAEREVARDEALRGIETAARDASATVSDLLALVREERVAPRLSEPVDLGALARRAAAAAPHDGLALDLALSDGCWVEGDERRLRRLVENLLENATRHARSRIALRVARDGRSVALTVEDDGDGVPAPLRERVFERFVRGSDDGAGSGLGLPICRAIARAHRGDVVLEGASRFVARIPRFAPEEF